MRRRIMVTVLLAVVAFLPLDLVTHVEQTLALTLSRLLFFAVYGSAILLLPRLSETGARRLLLAVAAGTSLAVSVMCAGTGGTASPAFSLLWALPLGMGLLFLDEPAAALLSGLTAALGALALLQGDQRPLSVTAYWVMITAVSTLISTTATALYRKVQRTEVELERQRAEALERLAAADRERARTERLVVLGRLAAGVAHEINNPLAYVRANIGLLKNGADEGRLPEKPELLDMLTESLGGLDRIATITQDLRSYARAPGEEAAPTAIDSVIDEALRFTRDRLSGFPIRRELAPDLPLVHASRGRLVQVLVNLIVNAADALEEAVQNGRPREELWIAVRAGLVEGRMRVEVVDNGPGLSPELEGQLFQPFVTTKPPGKGAGLGLALSFELIQRQGGVLTGENAPERGARFAFSLPLAA